MELPREHVLAGSEWADLAVALEDLKEEKRELNGWGKRNGRISSLFSRHNT